ncbi:adenosine kinase [Spirochaeta isovalerica]|uniref:Fructokinase n=1 Tax=Spirochaeta isovalerica TaxID=150 RepID=A0A841R8A8_9SPIO|nr:adenosine kinase [Spirochaeta isovalerica]MBB6478702.1 fructokinase [Spirochaeta isovalerica]
MSLKIPVIGIGNPLMDTITHVDFSVVENLGAEPGSMNLIDEKQLKKVLDAVVESIETPGGSCANTMRGLAWLLDGDEDFSRPVYTGAVGEDALAGRLSSGLESIGVKPELAGKSDFQTGVSIIFVTPDNERTMFTYLGACREYSKNDFPIHIIEGKPVWLHIAGYMWDTDNQKNAVKFAVEEALKRHTKISFDLADPFVVDRYREEFIEWLPGKIDLLFANRTELSYLTGIEGSDEDILEKAGKYGETIVMKVGKKGCWVSRRGYSIHFPCVDIAPPSDTTGAGDSFAAGFLYGIVKGETFHDCADTANRIASGIVTVEGCDYSNIDRDYVLGKK